MAAKKTKSRTTKSSKKPVSKAKKTVSRSKTTTKVKGKAKTSAKPKALKIAVGAKPFTKSQFVSTIAEHTDLGRKDITNVMNVISEIIAAHIKKRGPAAFSWPGLFKMKTVTKPATKAREGTNPFTGEKMMFKAKPASRKVKILPLKQLKEMASS